MELVWSCIRAFATTALLVTSAPFASVHTSVPTDHGSFGTACDIAHHTHRATPVDKASIDEFDLADHDSAPICPNGCPHLAGLGCCGSIGLATPSVIFAVVSAVGDLRYELDRSLSGVEPEAPKVPPQRFA